MIPAYIWQIYASTNLTLVPWLNNHSADRNEMIIDVENSKHRDQVVWMISSLVVAELMTS